MKKVLKDLGTPAWIHRKKKSQRGFEKTERRQCAKAILKDLGIFVGYNFCAVFVAFMFCAFFMRIDFLKYAIQIYFFRMVVYSLLSTLIVGMIAAFLRTIKKTANSLKFLDAKLIMSGFAISFLLIYSFLGVTSFTNDRSYTIFSLGYLYENADESYTQEEMEQVFIDGFVIKFGATKKRIDEQLNTGYITETDGKYQISEKGKGFIELQRFIDVLFPTATNPSSLYPNGNPKRDH